jgi:hypothetical protein
LGDYFGVIDFFFDYFVDEFRRGGCVVLDSWRDLGVCLREVSLGESIGLVVDFGAVFSH